MSPQDPSQSRIARSMESLDTKSLLSGFAALLLISRNLHHAHRLETLINLACATRRSGRSLANRSRLETLNHEADEWVGRLDDPWPHLATECFVFHGGNYLLIPGGAETSFLLRRFARMTDLLRDTAPAFAGEASALIAFGSALSTRILDGVGLRRNMSVEAHGELIVPPTPRLQKLRELVVLSVEALEDLAREVGAPWQVVERLVSRVGTSKFTSVHACHDLLVRTPIVRVEDDFVVAAPHLLSEALVHSVVELAYEHSEQNSFAEMFHLQIFATMQAACEGMSWREVVEPCRAFVPENALKVSHALYQIDMDKFIHLMVCSDAMADPNTWNTEGVAAELSDARTIMGDLLRQHAPIDVEMSTVVVVAGTGRRFGVEVQSAPETIAMHAAELEVVAEVVRRDGLLLWKFLKDWFETRVSVTIQSFAMLDTFSLWFNQGHRFFNRGGRLPNVVYAACDLQASLHEKVAASNDWHAVGSHAPGKLTEIGLAEGPERRVYRPRNASHDLNTPLVVVAPSGCPIWILHEQTGDDVVRQSMESMLARRMITFWVEEFAVGMPDEFAQTRGFQALRIYVSMAAVAADVVEIRSERSGVLRICISSLFTENYDDTNQWERSFAIRMIVALLECAGFDDPQARVLEAAERIAPIGVKRMTHAIRSHVKGEVSGVAIPATRHIQAFDRYRARQTAIGSRERNELLVGLEASKWLQEASERLLARLTEKLRPLNYISVLTRLLRLQEELHFEREINAMTLASTLACTNASVSARNFHEQQLQDCLRTLAANSFLIELVCWLKPSGQSDLSISALDECLALCTEIIEFGDVREIGRTRLSDVSVRLNVSDYEVYAEDYSEASGERYRQHSDVQHRAALRRNKVPGVGLKQSHPDRDVPLEVEILSKGLVKEIGMTLLNVAQFFDTLVILAGERNRSVVRLAASEVVERLQTELQWTSSLCERALSEFTLSFAGLDEVLDFVLKRDFVPWNTRRTCAFANYPVLSLSADEIMFSPRAVETSKQRFLQMLLSNRYPAKTDELKRAMSEVSEGPHKEFVETVAAFFRKQGMEAHVDVDKFGKLVIARSNGDVLGDIDVLAIDRKRRVLHAVECKDLALDRTPFETSNHRDKLFANRKSFESKHLARAAWLDEHKQDVLKHLGLPTDQDWTIDAYIVTSQPILASLLGKTQLRVLTFDQLQMEFDATSST